MTKEVKRNQWAQFFRKFNASNQYRHVRVSFRDKDSAREFPLYENPFLGLALEKKGRLIDGVQFYAGRADSDIVSEPVISLKQPERILVEKDETGSERRITIKTRDGLEATADLGDYDSEKGRRLVEKVAYSIYQKRGGRHGNDADDWLEAERKVREAEAMFV